jgi:hypothetical protein
VICSRCGEEIVDVDMAVHAVELIIERDRWRKQVASIDGYRAVFHPDCWSAVRESRYGSKRYRRLR